ncbi:MAG TPA: hypothetical protein VMO20_01605 [Candidatus Acidoferrum sp.]|nr:hypothetical protein [Candidatus Acidoferrum sp.]
MTNAKTTIAAILFLLSAMGSRAQQIPVGGDATDFSSVEYYQAPHQQQIKSRMSGAEAEPQEGGLLLIKQLKLEAFDENGKLQFVITAPECVYDPVKGVATSSGELHMRTGDEQLRIDGTGFLWRQSDSLLTISNQVQTVIEHASTIGR